MFEFMTVVCYILQLLLRMLTQYALYRLRPIKFLRSNDLTVYVLRTYVHKKCIAFVALLFDHLLINLAALKVYIALD
jgi:hypothetical protein